MQTSRRQQTWPTKWSLNLVNQILAAARTRIQATNVRGGASIGSTCAEGQHDEENARWRYFSASGWPGLRFHMTEAKHEPFRLYLFRSTSPQQRERERRFGRRNREVCWFRPYIITVFSWWQKSVFYGPWFVLCIQNSTLIVDLFIIPFCCILWLDYMRMHLINKTGVRFAEC